MGILVFSIANSDVPWFALPQIATGAPLHLRRLSGPNQSGSAATVEVCDTCDGPCRTIDTDVESLVWTGMVLRFTNLAAFEGVAVARLAYW